MSSAFSNSETETNQISPALMSGTFRQISAVVHASSQMWDWGNICICHSGPSETGLRMSRWKQDQSECFR